MSRRIALSAVCLAVLAGASACAQDPAEADRPPTTPAATVPAPQERGASFLTGRVERVNGRVQNLAAYRGKVVLVVNTASRCGNTPQYEGLEAMYRENRDAGLVILAFPSNDFAGQEPGSNREIAEFCRLNYGVTFPVFAKTPVTGPNAHPLFARLAAASEPPDWNFAKYLLDRQGRLVAFFDASVQPDSPSLQGAVRTALAEPGDV